MSKRKYSKEFKLTILKEHDEMSEIEKLQAENRLLRAEKKRQQMEYPIRIMCEILNINRAAYYKWKNRINSNNDNLNELTAEKVMEIHDEHPDMGYRRIRDIPEHLKQMIKSVYNGTGVMEETILESLAKNVETKASCFSEEGYTSRETDIIKAVAEGLSNKEIAGRLFISEGTVKNYITSILARENLSHRTALAVYYLTGKK